LARRCDDVSEPYFFLAAVFRAALAFFTGLTGASGWAGLSPISPLSGQILKAGHFWQPATMAIGQSVMGKSSKSNVQYGADSRVELGSLPQSVDFPPGSPLLLTDVRHCRLAV
jgi:hypothetical protein